MWYEFMFRGVGDDGVGDLVKAVLGNRDFYSFSLYMYMKF